MKKFLVLLGLIAMFMACDYASDSVELYPDIEIVSIDPLSLYMEVVPDFPQGEAKIDEVKIVAENSMDCYIQQVNLQYYDVNGDLFYEPEPIPVYAKINGIVQNGVVDTATIGDLYFPIDSVIIYLANNNLHSARLMLNFIAIDEYFGGSRADTAAAWFGIYLDY